MMASASSEGVVKGGDLSAELSPTGGEATQAPQNALLDALLRIKRRKEGCEEGCGASSASAPAAAASAAITPTAAHVETHAPSPSPEPITSRSMSRQANRGPAYAVWCGGVPGSCLPAPASSAKRHATNGPVDAVWGSGWDFQITEADWEALVAASRPPPAPTLPRLHQPSRPVLEEASAPNEFRPVKDLPGRERGKPSRDKSATRLNASNEELGA